MMKPSNPISGSRTKVSKNIAQLSLSKLKAIAKKAVWRIATLPAKESAKLRQATGKADEYWFNTTGAGMYCLCKTGDSDTDWHSVLSENRRAQNDLVSLFCTGKKPRGNVDRYGELRHYIVKRKVYYTAIDLDEWLENLPSRTIH